MRPIYIKIPMLLTSVVLTLLVTACSHSPSVQTGPYAEQDAAGLTKLDYSGFDKTYVDPEANFNKYTKFMFAPLDFSVTEVIDPEYNNVHRSEWEFTQEDRALLQEKYEQAIQQAFKKSDTLELVDEPGPDVIIVKSKLMRFAPTTPKYNSPERTARSKFLAKSSATITMDTQLIESGTDHILANISDTREMGDDLNLYEITRPRFVLDIKYGFQRWANVFKNEFERMQNI